MVLLTTIANLGDKYPRASTCSIGQLENGQQLLDTSNPLLLRCRAVFAAISQRLFRASQKDHSPRSTTTCSGSGKVGEQVNFFRGIWFSENSLVLRCT